MFRYCRTVEGYDNLVVHGPLMATYLAQAAATHLTPPHARIVSLSWRATSPILMSDQVTLHGGMSVSNGGPGSTADANEQDKHDTATLYIQKQSGEIAMRATMTFAPA